MPVVGIPDTNDTYVTSSDGSVYFPYYNSTDSTFIWDNLNFQTPPDSLVFRFNSKIERVSGMKFTGIYEISNRSESLLSDVDLVIYNTQDPEVQTSLLTLLAFFETNTSGQIKNLRDIRKITNVKNEPVAKWLTSSQDETLNYLYDQIKNYAQLWMNPETAGESIYERELDQ